MRVILFLLLDGKNKICTTSSEAHAMFYFPMMDKQVRGQMVYRLLPLGCFLTGCPVVDVAVVHVALMSVSGPLCFQRESSRGSCWKFGAREDALFKL